MQLTDRETIARLTSAEPQRGFATPPPKLPSRIVRRRCACGNCAACVDNARWERIFEAKFADRDYYTRPVMRQGSPLSALV